MHNAPKTRLHACMSDTRVGLRAQPTFRSRSNTLTQPNPNPQVSWGAASWPLTKVSMKPSTSEHRREHAGFGQLTQLPLTNICEWPEQGSLGHHGWGTVALWAPCQAKNMGSLWHFHRSLWESSPVLLGSWTSE